MYLQSEGNFILLTIKSRRIGQIVLPISQDEINANPTIAKQQNPGY